MRDPDLDELRQRSDELEARLKAFRATMKPAPPAASSGPIRPSLRSRQWFAELLWAPLVIAGYIIVTIFVLTAPDLFLLFGRQSKKPMHHHERP